MDAAVDFLERWQAALYLVGNIAGVVFILVLKSKFVTRQEHNSVAAEVQRTKERVASLEQFIQNLPNQRELFELKLTMVKLQGMMETFGERFDFMRQLDNRFQLQIDRIEEFLKDKAA